MSKILWKEITENTLMFKRSTHYADCVPLCKNLIQEYENHTTVKFSYITYINGC